MATDNTLLNVGSGGDTIRTLAKTGNSGAKTEVVQLDAGGGDANAESLVSASNPLPVNLQYVSGAVGDLHKVVPLLYQILYTLEAIRLQDANFQNAALVNANTQIEPSSLVNDIDTVN